MPTMVVRGHVQTNQTALDYGITDLMVMEQDGQTVLYASSGQLGGLTSFGLAADGTATMKDTQLYSAAWSDGVLRDLALVEVNGQLSIAVAGSGADQLRLFGVNADGSIGTESQMSGLETSISRLLDVNQTDASTLFMADKSSGLIRGFAISDNGSLSQAMQVADTTATYAAEVMALGSTEVMGSTYIISASQTEKGVSVYRMDGTTLVNTGNAGVNEGLGIMTPTAMEVIDINGRSFVLLASAPSDGLGQSGAITVMELAQDGSLVATDHIIDTALTRFGSVQSLEVVEADGRVYVAAGGGDDGLSLFVLMPHGRLQLLSTISGDAGLENVSSMAANFSNGMLQMYVSSEVERGVTQIAADVSNHGIVVEGDHGGGTIMGTAQDDILIGGAGNDSIVGGTGDDLLEDGLGVDTMHGGNGADIFILRSDFTHDVIQDFQPGSDRLDLSAWPMLYDPASIGYTATATGAILSWRGETLEIFTRNGATLSMAQVQAAIMASPDRVPDFSSFGGNGGDQDITGTAINDAVSAGEGNDTVQVFAGDDYVDAGNGDDWVDGGGGRDTIFAGSGNDEIYGGTHNDLIYGGAGDDRVYGGNNDDVILGGDGRDLLSGERGHDTLYGGNGRDTIFGGNNNDVLYGEGDNDVLRGGIGHDLIYGGGGHDRIIASNDNDTVYAGSGNDRILGGYQSDLLYGEAGDDVISGGSGFDTINGGSGNDTLHGNFNADRFIFEDGHGHDIIVDFEALSKPEKIDFSDLSTMNDLGMVLAASQQLGADVLITTSATSSILLQDVALSDLDADDFVF